MNRNVKIAKEKIEDFCTRNFVRRLSIFGSALREDFKADSDIDVLVEFLPGHTPGFFGLFDMEEELSDIFGGRKIDLRTPNDLSRYFRDEVVASAEVQYAKN